METNPIVIENTVPSQTGENDSSNDVIQVSLSDVPPQPIKAKNIRNNFKKRKCAKLSCCCLFLTLTVQLCLMALYFRHGYSRNNHNSLNSLLATVKQPPLFNITTKDCGKGYGHSVRCPSPESSHKRMLSHHKDKKNKEKSHSKHHSDHDDHHDHESADNQNKDKSLKKYDDKNFLYFFSSLECPTGWKKCASELCVEENALCPIESLSIVNNPWYYNNSTTPAGHPSSYESYSELISYNTTHLLSINRAQAKSPNYLIDLRFSSAQADCMEWIKSYPYCKFYDNYNSHILDTYEEQFTTYYVKEIKNTPVIFGAYESVLDFPLDDIQRLSEYSEFPICVAMKVYGLELLAFILMFLMFKCKLVCVPTTIGLFLCVASGLQLCAAIVIQISRHELMLNLQALNDSIDVKQWNDMLTRDIDGLSSFWIIPVLCGFQTLFALLFTSNGKYIKSCCEKNSKKCSGRKCRRFRRCRRNEIEQVQIKLLNYLEQNQLSKKDLQ